MKKETYHIVRTNNAGVFFGVITEKDGDSTTLDKCCRLWYWDGAASLSQIALEGVKKPDNCKFTVSVDGIEVLETIERIPCTEKAVKNIKAVSEWKQ